MIDNLKIDDDDKAAPFLIAVFVSIGSATKRR